MYFYNPDKKRWETDTYASQVPIKDPSDSFDSNNVEGALQELAGERDAQKILINNHTTKIESMQDNIDWLKANGGGGGGGTGGGGTVMPTITTTDELSQVVPKGQEITLNVFFSSPNLGQGSLVLLINNKEVNSFTIKQGSNSINIGILKDLRNKVVIYAKDRANLVSNEITYNIINGGVSLDLDFDYYADYPANKNVLMRYNIDTEQKDVQLEVTIDNNKSSVACKNGYNEYYFKNLTVGIHDVTVRAVSGKFISETYNFNLVIIDSDSLYISSTFGENPKCTLGVPVVIDYRISYKDDTAVTLVLTLDGKVNKTLTSKRGSYAWTLNDMTLGSHSYKIECTLGTDTVKLEGTFVVEAGDYTPLQINTDGLRYQMGCANRTNQDDDKEQFIYDNGVSQITTTLHGFNFETNGWIDGALVCNGGAYAEIDYACMADNAPYSLTVEIDFKATDIGIHDARVLECRDTDTKKGFHVALTEAKLNSISQEAKVYITPEERTTVSLQIDRQNKFAKIYVNGIITSAFKLTDSGSGTSTVLESFAHNGKIYVGCDKNLDNIGNCTIYDIRVYERRVSNDEIVKNVIAQEKDLRKQEDLYNFCFNNNTLSTMRLYSDEVENKVENMTNTNKITMRAVYRSTNTEKYGQPFELKYCKVYWQGTSSLDYIRKNYNLELYDDDLKEFYYSPYPNSVQEYLFCLKCDYMESSHARNVGIGNLINKYWYTSKNPAQLKNDMVQNAVQGFPMLLYINDEFMGVYNFNTDRYSNASFGYTGDECLAYELSANSDTTAGAFITYDKTKHEGNELDYYKRDFMCLYPPTRRAGNDTMGEIIDLVKFVDKSSDEEFVTNINNNVYFNKEYLLRYLIYCLVMGAVDSLGKNMKLATWDMGKTWYPQIYDCDTTMGLDNSGMLYYTDSSMKIQAGTYNTSSSRLWSRLIELMWADIQAEYVKMRNTYLTLDNLYSCIINNQMDLIPATYYNSDCETKYLQFGALYLDVLHGQGKQQVMEWLRARLLFLDTYMEYWTTTSEFISLRAGKDGLAYIDLEMFDNMYAQIKWRNTGKEDDALAIQIKEVKKNTVTRFEFNVQASTDQEIRIFGANYVKSLGDLSNLELVKIDVSNATRLTKMECHSSKLKNVILSTCTNLQHVDLKDCTTLGSTEQSTKNLDVSRCSNLKYVNCQNTQLQGITLNPKGSNIKEVWYPKSIQTVSFANCPQLETVGLEYGHSCKELRIVNCPNVKHFGDQEGDETKNKYKYPNGYFLGGVQSLYLDNSYDVKELAILGSYMIQEVTLKNMKNMEEVTMSERLSVEALAPDSGTKNQRPYNPTLEKTKKFGDFKLNIIGCNKLKTFSTKTNYCRRNWYSDFTLDNVNLCKDKLDASKLYEQRYYQAGFHCNICDLSNTSLENINLGITSYIVGLVLPNTTKKIRINSGINYFKDDQYEFLYGGTYTGGYNPSDFGWDALGVCKSIIYSMAISKDALENFKWKLADLTLTDFDYPASLKSGYLEQSSKLVYTDFNITDVEINVTPEKYAPTFHTDIFNNIKGKLDFSNFHGYSLCYAMAKITDNVNITLPTADNLNNIKIANFILELANTTKIGWDFVELIYPYMTSVYSLKGFANVTLKEQVDYETEGIILMNNSVYGGFLYGTNGFEGSNLKYVKELNVAMTSLLGFFKKSKLVKIGNIKIGNDSSTDCSYEGTSSMFNNCPNLEEVGDINITINKDSTTTNYGVNYMFQKCPKLRKVGNITKTSNIGKLSACVGMFADCPALAEIGNLNIPISDAMQMFSACKSLKSLTLNLETCTKLSRTFDGAIIENLDLGALSTCENITDMTYAFQGSKIKNLLGFNAFPRNVKEAYNCFANADINDGNFVLPPFLAGCVTTNIGSIIANGNVSLPSPFVVPSSVQKLGSMAEHAKNLPKTLVFDCSNIENLLNNNSVFKECQGLEELTWKIPQYVWDIKINDGGSINRSNYFLQNAKNLKKVTFDWSAYKGDGIGTNQFLYGAYPDLTLEGIDFNLFGHSDISNGEAKGIKDFTVHGACNTRDIDLRSWRMTYENYLKFVEEAIATLDCVNLGDFIKLELGTLDDKGNPIDSDDKHRTKDYIAVKSYKTLNIQITLQGIGDRYIMFYDKDKNYLSSISLSAGAISQGRTFDVPAKASYLKIANLDYNEKMQISLTYTNPDDTPKTLTMGAYTDYAGTGVLTAEQKETIITKGTAKGWNMVFV